MKARKTKPSSGTRCPFCRSPRTVHAGFRHGAATSKQLFLCKSCGRKSTHDNGYLRMRYPPETIREAVSLYGKGYSLAEVRLRLERKGVGVSRWTILKWARRYASHKKHSI